MKVGEPYLQGCWLAVISPVRKVFPLVKKTDQKCSFGVFFDAHTYLKRTVAEDFGENRRWEVGDDRQEDCYAGCDDDHYDVDMLIRWYYD